MEQDIRWQQRLDNYNKAFARLSEAISLMENCVEDSYKELAKEGVIQRFEFTHELAWKVMKDYLEYQGYAVIGSRDAIRQALKTGLIENKEWLDSIESRNLTSHTYDQDVAEKIYDKIQKIYYPLMEDFRQKMNKFVN